MNKNQWLACITCILGARSSAIRFKNILPFKPHKNPLRYMHLYLHFTEKGSDGLEWDGLEWLCKLLTGWARILFPNYLAPKHSAQPVC